MTAIDQSQSNTIIERALRTGAKMHAFRSGGGLHVVRLEYDNKLVGYGEHPDIDDAMIHTAEDVVAGGRPYSEVYGPDATYDCYMTGSSSPNSQLNAWLRNGSTFDAYVDDYDLVVFELHGYMDQEMPEGMMGRVIETGETETFEDRGYTFEVSPTQFANGEPGVSRRTIGRPDNDRPAHRDTHYEVCKTGRGTTFAIAIAAAFAAEPVEKMDK